MRKIGDDIYIQRGETWSLDFDVVTKKGHPFMILKTWQNPYLAITVSAALYEQKGDYRETHWLDLNKRWVEKSDGSVELEDTKKFISTEALFARAFDVEKILQDYSRKIVLDENSDFDITNYLFYTDLSYDGNYVYKYIESYTYDGENIFDVVWKEYSFRIIKTFDTKSWMEQGYFYDAKIITGESLQDMIKTQLSRENKTYSTEDWSDDEIQNYINSIENDEIRNEAQELFDEGIPLRNTYDTKSLIIDPSRLYVSVNIQGGVG